MDSLPRGATGAWLYADTSVMSAEGVGWGARAREEERGVYRNGPTRASQILLQLPGHVQRCLCPFRARTTVRAEQGGPVATAGCTSTA
jgi:hypothetical protein